MGYWLRLLLFVSLIVVQVDGTKSWLEEEKRGLLDIKLSLMQHNNINNVSMDHSSFLPSWVSDNLNSDSCGWERVTCDPSSAQIIHLSLHNLTHYPCSSSVSSFNMSLLLSFKHLTTFNLSYNCFEGLIGIQDGRRKSTFIMLKTLDLSNNKYLNESIMKPLTAFTSLNNLILSYCSIGGSFPIQELSALRNLEVLDLSVNFLSSPSSTVQDTNSLSKLKKLSTLHLNINSLDTNIFKYLVALPALKHLFLSFSFFGIAIDGVLRNDSGLCLMTQLQELDLSNNDLIGTLENTCLGNLTSLRVLDLSYNSLNGSIPSSLVAPLVSLDHLSLSHNNFEGFSLNSLANNSKLKVLSLGGFSSSSDPKKFQVETENPPWIPSFQLEHLELSNVMVNLPSRTFPTFLSYQHDLKYLDLANNNLVGVFPNWLLLNNTRLTYLSLYGNSLTGFLQFPSDLYQPLDQLSYLDLSNNKIQGKFPINIGYFLPNLKSLYASGNMLEGDIPASIGEMSNLIDLDLSHNNFSGKIPKDILLRCISLESLIVSYNNLEGNIFSTPMNLRSLGILLVNNNQFNGTLEGGLFLSLLALDLSSNNFSGKLPGWIVKSATLILRVSGNYFEGTIPVDLCKNGRLQVLDLSHNRFSGEIPPCIFNSTSLIFISLRSNSFIGTIPEISSNSSSLEGIDMSNNKFSGFIPKSFYRVSHLAFLSLANNQLEGQLPSQICQLQQINILDLSHNNFIGLMPSCFNNMSFGNYPMSLTIAYLGGLLSVYGQDVVQIVTKGSSLSYKGQILQHMSGLDLSLNQLTGEIPYHIGSLQALRALNLSRNHLNGTIPNSLHNLKEIESLDLSYNNLTGEIPPQLQELHYLSVFNVCYNNLSGRAPNQGQFANFDESNYRGNPNLWWTNTNRRTAEPPTLEIPLNDTQGSEFPIDLTAFYWSFGASYVVVLLTLVTILWINPYWRRVWFYFITICIQKSFGRFFEDVFF